MCSMKAPEPPKLQKKDDVLDIFAFVCVRRGAMYKEVCGTSHSICHFGSAGSGTVEEATTCCGMQL